LFCSFVLSGPVAEAQSEPADPEASPLRRGRLPICFIENRGVHAPEVAYFVQGADRSVFFTATNVTIVLNRDGRRWAVKLEFVGARREARPSGRVPRGAVVSYFRGGPDDWKTGLETYGEVVYADLWPGIDLIYRGTVDRLKYEFRVRPGADPQTIRLRYRGAEAVRLTDAGALRVETPLGGFEDAPPSAYQEIDGSRKPVAMEYAIDRRGDDDAEGCAFGFRLGAYDRSRPLVLDPAVIVYCGFIGGVSTDEAAGMAVDAAGNAYVTGWTASSEASFPVKAGPDLTFNGGNFPMDAFVAKVNAAGTALVYCGFIGGSGDDQGVGIAVDSVGAAYVTGRTASTEATFPVTVGPDTTFNGSQDAFVAKVDPTGQKLLYCGYIGGTTIDEGMGIAVDAAGSAYLVGTTFSTEGSFPVKGGPDLTYNGSGQLGGDAFVAKVDAAGNGLVYCGYIGGSTVDIGNAIAVDSAGYAYVAGWTASTHASFPVRVGPDVTFNGQGQDCDAFVAKVALNGSRLEYCGYIGGSNPDQALGIAVHAGQAYVVGYTMSTASSFPVKGGPDLTFNGKMDAFVARVSATGAALDFCGYIGGSDDDSALGVGVDAASNILVAGITSSTEATFPVQGGPDVTHNGFSDAFLATVVPNGQALIQCGYLGGSAIELPQGFAADRAGNAYVAGWTTSTETTFPVRVGPDLTFNSARQGVQDGFVAKVARTLIYGTGSPQIGQTIQLGLVSTDDAGLFYQAASSLGTGPIPIGNRTLGLSPDPLLSVSVNGYWPWMFANYRGFIDSQGHASAAIHLPNVTALRGLRIHTAFVTLSPPAPWGIKSISNTFSFTVQ